MNTMPLVIMAPVKTIFRKRHAWHLLGLLAVLATTVRADVSLPSIFSDHAVLQRSGRVPVWGNASPGEEVKVALAGANASTRTDSSGHWRVTLALDGADVGPHTMEVLGRNRLVISDVLVGEVWLASGQSNMEFKLSQAIGGKEEVAQSAGVQVREFRVKKTASPEPQEAMVGSWAVAGPATSGAFTAVGYFFAKAVSTDLHRPVGLIHASWGGTPVEAWMGSAAFDHDPELKAGRDRSLTQLAEFPQAQADYIRRYEAWADKYSRRDQVAANVASYAAVSVGTEGWKPVTMPGTVEKMAGAVWLRREVDIPAVETGWTLKLDLGRLDDFDVVYWNGERLAGTTYRDAGSVDARSYTVPVGKVNAGKNVIAIRLFSPRGAPRVEAKWTPFRAGSVSLAGEWQAKPEFELPPLSADAREAWPQAPRKPSPSYWQPSFLFNGMIHPVLPYAMRGVIWYQGENNLGRGYQYRTAFKLMIEDWRAERSGDVLPFYFCQLPNHGSKATNPGESTWATLRESQAQALTLPSTGQAVIIDVGESGDIHPRNKRDPGERLARLALGRTYGRPVVDCGPVYSEMRVEGGKVRIQFEVSSGGLVAQTLPTSYRRKSSDAGTVPLLQPSPGSELQGFTICGADRQWKWAQAKIDGTTVVVWSPEISVPVAVRYAWADDPTCNLYNGIGLPASPFRTDSFPPEQQDKKF